jgi:hypothetical protein
MLSPWNTPPIGVRITSALNYGCEMPVCGPNWKLPLIGNGSAIFAEPVRNLLGRQKVEEAIQWMSIRS